MKILLACLLLVGCFLCGTQHAKPEVPFLLGVVVDSPRTVLENLWNDTSATQTERAYCVTQYSKYSVLNTDGPTILFRVDEIEEAQIEGATPASIEKIFCGDDRPIIHTHPPASCTVYSPTAMNCTLGGLYAWDCQPSRVDYESLLEHKAEFGVVQCDRHALRFFYPSDMLAHTDSGGL